MPGVTAYAVVPDASEVQISGKSSVHPIRGRAVDVEGSIEADVSDGHVRSLAGRVEVPVRNLRSGNALQDSELQRRVDARRFPTIVGQVGQASALGDGGVFRVDGDVTFHGVKKTVSDDVRVSVDGERLILEGEHVFDIREFGVKPPRILMLRVEPTVTVRIKLVAAPVD